MSRVALTLFAVCLLTLTAGCSGLGGDEPTDRDPYGVDETLESSTPTDPPQEPASPDYLLPGLTADEVVDGSAFYDGHVDALENRTYIHRVEGEYVDRNGTTTGQFELVVEESRSDQPALAVKRVEGEHVGIDEGVRAHWVGDGERFVRIETANGSVEYSRDAPRQIWTPVVWILDSLSTAENVTVSAIDEDDGSEGGDEDGVGDGNEHENGNETNGYHIEGQNADAPVTFEASTSYTIEVTANADGLVTAYTLAGIADADEGLEYVEQGTYTISDEITLERPEWVEDARDELEGESSEE